jgi:hypothetical protein
MSEISPNPHANPLRNAASSYLRSAMHQPVQWHEWGSEALALAAAEDKPILLDIGAVWCHWCHVMDRESYEDPVIAAILNERYIAVKVDRDERPDLDARYQAAVSAISGQGGWPLTGFLASDGRPFFGGTYFPREERYGRPGFERVLLMMASAWRDRREEVLESAASVMAAIEHNESFAGRSGALSLKLVDAITASAIKQFDARYGGFGSQPKFPHPAALDLLLDLATRTENAEAKQAVLVTLDRMSHGGVYDQLGGGFHRYSVDERWVVPHFEKMLYDNTELLRNYLHAYQSYAEPDHARVAKDIMRWMNEWLSDQQQGGFYASQDADITLDDDGDYFTWTLDEAREVLSEEELELASTYWHIGELGDMHHSPAKNVLHSEVRLEELAAKSAKPMDEVRELLAIAKSKLYAARCDRPTPFIDRTLYTGWNALGITAYLEAAQTLAQDASRDFALKTLERLLASAWSAERGLHHVIAYADGVVPGQPVAALLDDYAFTISACLNAWSVTGELRYYSIAKQMADRMIADFFDGTAFFDTAKPSPGSTPPGALAARRMPLQDAPTPAGNPSAVSAILRLYELSGDEAYRKIAEETLASFAGIVEHFGLYSCSYGLALVRLLLDPVQVVVVGEGDAAEALALTALSRYESTKTVIRLHSIAPEQLPPALAETLPNLVEQQQPFALICKGRSCQPPVYDAEALLEALK